MSRARLTVYAVLAAALLVVGAHTVTAAADPPMARATPLPTPTDREWSLSGPIQSMNGEFWSVQGFVIRVTGSTQIIGDLPSIGSVVSARGTVLADGTWLATELRIGQATPTPSPTPFPTVIPSPTASPGNALTIDEATVSDESSADSESEDSADSGRSDSATDHRTQPHALKSDGKSNRQPHGRHHAERAESARPER